MALQQAKRLLSEFLEDFRLEQVRGQLQRSLGSTLGGIRRE